MNKNDKFHGAEFEISARDASDGEPNGAAGGSLFYESCAHCGGMLYPAG